jgi:hypothetical protein
MKRVNKSISGLVATGLLILVLATTASAQRGRSHFSGGFRGGSRFGFGFGGPGISFGFGYRPYYAYPRIGFYLNTLPYGYYPFMFGPDQYYYYGGTFYRPSDNGYQVAAPPIGAAVPQLPPNTRPIMIDGVQYFERGGVYYKEGVDDKGKKIFIVSGKDGVLNTDNAANNLPPMPKVGDIVTQLPDGCRKVTLSGKKYFISPDDIYYEEFKDANDSTSYRIASVPEDEAPQPPPPAPAKPDGQQ